MLVPLAPRSSSAREVYFSLRDAILSGAIPAGTRLLERRLAADLGVSRTPVREALKLLEAEELVVPLPAGGSSVREVTAAEVKETYEIRVLLECFAARRAAERISRSEVAQLEELNRKMRAVADDEALSDAEEVKQLAELNAAFHRLVVSASGNRVLERTLQALIETPLYARSYFWFTKDRRRSSLDDHERLTELLRAGNASEAARVWLEHLSRGRDSILTGLGEGGTDPGAGAA